MTTLPERASLAELQAFIAAFVAEKGWTADPDQIYIRMTEEVGEVGKEVRRSWKKGNDAVREDIGAELADVAMYLLDLANAYGVDLETAIRAKVDLNRDRTWDH